jgi:deazaflavin-dependent oxidoreductase (nitroreductase family)
MRRLGSLYNPLVRRRAAGRRPPFALVRHVGRRTGRVRETPVVAVVTARGVLVPLTYGPGTDWCRNVLAAGGCTVLLRGRDYRLARPAVIDRVAVLGLFPPPLRVVMRALRITQVLLLELPEAATDVPERPERSRSIPPS